MAAGRFRQHVYSGLDTVKKIKNRLVNFLDPPVLILIYHRVTSLPSDPQLLSVSPNNFLSHMLYLKDNFPVLRFEEDWSKIKEPSVVITFDDGYADNANEALPILEHVGIPATFFISTGELGSTGELWWDELERILLVNNVLPSSFHLRDEFFGRSWPTVSCFERGILYEELHSLIKRIGPVRRDDWFKQLRAWADIAKEGRATHRVLTVAELKKLGTSRLVTIGAHTVSHTPLATLSAAEQWREIIESKRQLNEWTGREITVFSYPFGGKADYTRESISLCRKAGFVKATSNFPGQFHRWTNKFQIPRQLVRNWDLGTFAVNVQKFWSNG